MINTTSPLLLVGSIPLDDTTAVLDAVADYIRRRVPTSAPAEITVDAPADLEAALTPLLREPMR